MLAGYFFAIAATALWSGNFIVARGLNESIPPISLAFWRWVVAVVVFLPFAAKRLIDEWCTIREHLRYLSVTAFVGITLFNMFIFYAAHTTTAMNLSLIAISSPIFIVIFSRILFQELITFKKGAGIILVLAGVLLLISKGTLSILLDISFAIGDIWMLAASILFAVYSILVKQKPKQLSISAFQLATFILGLIFLFPFFIWEHATTPSVVFDTAIVASILYVGIFASLSAFVLWHRSICIIGPSKAGMIYYTLPVFSGISAYFFLNEAISMIHFYSVLLIVSGIVITNHEAKKVSVGVHP